MISSLSLGVQQHSHLLSISLVLEALLLRSAVHEWKMSSKIDIRK